MQNAFDAWNASVDESVTGKDYPEGKVNDSEPASRFWMDDERYKPFFDDFRTRPQLAGRLKSAEAKKKAAKDKRKSKAAEAKAK